MVFFSPFQCTSALSYNDFLLLHVQNTRTNTCLGLGVSLTIKRLVALADGSLPPKIQSIKSFLLQVCLFFSSPPSSFFFASSSNIHPGRNIRHSQGCSMFVLYCASILSGLLNISEQRDEHFNNYKDNITILAT